MYFLVKAYDGAGNLGKRMEVRGRHFENITELCGHVLCAGALTDEDGKMTGSMLVMDFPSRKELDDYLAGEPYLQEHVWERVEVDRMNVAVFNREMCQSAV